MKVSSAALAFAAAALLPKLVASKEAEETPSDASAQQHLRRANVFDSNSVDVPIIVVLNDEGRRRKLAGAGQATAAERQAAAEENKAAASAAAQSMGVVARYTYGSALYGFATRAPPGLVKIIEADPRVKYVENDAIIQLDPVEVGGNRRRLARPGGGGGAPPQTTPWGITRVNGGTDYTGNGKAYVIDTGIDLKHPDLNVDVGLSRYFVGRNPNDENGHGTHVAGTIAARNNGIGVVGVAAGAPVVSVRVLDRNGSGLTSGVIAGVDYVAATCVAGDVANMSLGGSKYNPLNDAVIAASGSCPFVVAAGNSGANAANYSPASANGPNIYTISAFSDGDNWASFSNYGADVDYAGPGLSILSTWKGGGYNTISGTSMASPHIAGVKLVGSIASGGTVNGDPDGNPDPIGVC